MGFTSLITSFLQSSRPCSHHQPHQPHPHPSHHFLHHLRTPPAVVSTPAQSSPCPSPPSTPRRKRPTPNNPSPDPALGLFPGSRSSQFTSHHQNHRLKPATNQSVSLDFPSTTAPQPTSPAQLSSSRRGFIFRHGARRLNRPSSRMASPIPSSSASVFTSPHAPNPMPGRRVHSAAHYTAGYDPSRPGHYPSMRNPEYSGADGSPTLRRFPGLRQSSSNSTSASPKLHSKKLPSPPAHTTNSNSTSPSAKHSALRGASRASAYSRVHPAGPSKYSPLPNDSPLTTTSSSRRRSSRRASSVLQRSSHMNAPSFDENTALSNMDPTAEPPSLPQLPKVPRSPDHLPQRFSDQYHSRPSKFYPPTMSRPSQAVARPRPPPIPLPRPSPPSRLADCIVATPNPIAIAPCLDRRPDVIVRSLSNPLLSVPSDIVATEAVTDVVSPSPPPIPLSKPQLAPLPISQLTPLPLIQLQPDSAPALRLAIPSAFMPPAKRPGKNNIHLRRPPPLITSPDTPGFAGNDGPANPIVPSLIEPVPLRRDERPRIQRDATSFVTKGSDSNDGSAAEGDPDVDGRTSLGESEQGTSVLKTDVVRSPGLLEPTCLGIKPVSDADIDPYMFDEASNSSFGGSEDAMQLPKNVRRSRAPGDVGEIQEDDFQMVGGDGALFDGGFILFSDGRIQTPEKVMRKTSEGLAVEGIPSSSNNLIIVRSLSEFKKSHTFKTNNNGSSTLGRGAAGRVYLAVHEPSQRKIAVKEINFFHQEKRNQLRKELVTLISHQSRFLVRSYGAFYDGNGIVHVTLEYMDCGSLSDVIQKRGAVPEAVICKIAEHCLRGLCFLHSNHILHRDVKTGNILLSRKLCRAKLSDFGLARDLKEDVNNEGRTDSVTKTFVGTLNYMSPERLNGQEYTYASDIWALGISLVECILGRCPFDKMKGFFEVFYATESPLAEQVRKLVSHELYDLIRLMTDREANNRPTARELLQHDFIKAGRHNVNDLRRWLDDIPRLDCDDKDMSQGSVRVSRRSVEKRCVAGGAGGGKVDRKSKASTRGHALDWKKQRSRPK